MFLRTRENEVSYAAYVEARNRLMVSGAVRIRRSHRNVVSCNTPAQLKECTLCTEMPHVPEARCQVSFVCPSLLWQAFTFQVCNQR